MNLVEQPTELKTSLYPHQLVTVYEMEQLENKRYVQHENVKTFTDMGICADMTGYGKTVSAIALIVRNRMKWNLNEDYVCDTVKSFSNHHVKQYESSIYNRINTTLILVGPSIVDQWKNELSKTNLKYETITNTKIVHSIDVTQYDVIVVTPNMFNRLRERYPRVAWKRFVYDEPTTVRVPSMQTIVAGFTWFITATPDEIKIRHRDCKKSHMYRIVTDGFEQIRPLITIKNSDYFVQKSFEMPSTMYFRYECHVPAFRWTNGIVSERISKMIEAGNISGAVQAMGGQKSTSILDLVKRIKTAELEDVKSKIRRWETLNDSERVKEWMDREKEVLEQITQLTDRFHASLQERCPICYDRLQKPILEPNCQNMFCGKCLLTWLQKKGNCPLCRRVVDQTDLITLENEEDRKEQKMEKKLLNKEETIVQILKDRPEGRFIIFSNYDESFDPIRSILKSNQVNFVEIRGSVENRARNIEKYRSGEAKVVFLNSNTDSSGINLQETTDIIVYHNMSEGTKQQIIGRANRIGRKTPLCVHALVASN